MTERRQGIYVSEWNNEQVYGPSRAVRHEQSLDNVAVLSAFGSRELLRIAKQFKHLHGADSRFGLAVYPDPSAGISGFTDLSRTTSDELQERNFPWVSTWVELSRSHGPSAKKIKLSLGLSPQVTIEPKSGPPGPITVDHKYIWTVNCPNRSAIRDAYLRFKAGSNFDLDFGSSDSLGSSTSVVKSPKKSLAIIEFFISKYFSGELNWDTDLITNAPDGALATGGAKWNNMSADNYGQLFHKLNIWIKGGDLQERSKGLLK